MESCLESGVSPTLPPFSLPSDGAQIAAEAFEGFNSCSNLT